MSVHREAYSLLEQEKEKRRDKRRREEIGVQQKKKKKHEKDEREKEKMMNILNSMRCGPVVPDSLKLRVFPDFHSRLSVRLQKRSLSPLDCFFLCLPIEELRILAEKIDADRRKYWYKEMRRHLKKYFTISVGL